MYHKQEVVPELDIRSKAPPARRAGKSPVCVTARIAFQGVRGPEYRRLGETPFKPQEQW